MILDLSAIASLQETVGDLQTEGWSFLQEFHRLRVERAVASPAEARYQLQRFGDALTVLVLEGTYGNFRIGLKLFGTTFEVVSLPDGSLERFFEETVHRELARRLEDREAEAAFALPLAWYATADVNLGRALPNDSGLELRVVVSSEWITREITGAGVDGISRFVPEGPVRRIYIALEGPAEDAHFGSVSL